MGYKKTIQRDGAGSHKIYIDRALLEILGWKQGTVLDITTDGVSLMLRADGVDAAGGKVGLRSRATIKRKTNELLKQPRRKRAENADNGQ